MPAFHFPFTILLFDCDPLDELRLVVRPGYTNDQDSVGEPGIHLLQIEYSGNIQFSPEPSESSLHSDIPDSFVRQRVPLHPADDQGPADHLDLDLILAHTGNLDLYAELVGALVDIQWRITDTEPLLLAFLPEEKPYNFLKFQIIHIPFLINRAALVPL
ncbi:hypothetical protein SCFA_300012 [anaerobic digester metagenome]|uniref:Uncharacterized protein n=1 Tax=anaerobic digester metagenome TaxID=1263854 RepID=A0A485M0R6_9ZZZZ